MILSIYPTDGHSMLPVRIIRIKNNSDFKHEFENMFNIYFSYRFEHYPLRIQSNKFYQGRIRGFFVSLCYESSIILSTEILRIVYQLAGVKCQE